MEGVSMKKLAAILVSFFVIAGCAHVTAKDCAKFALQVGVGVAVMAATGVDIMDYDPWSTNAILADVAVDSSMAVTGYVFDEMTEPDYSADQALAANEDITLPEDSLACIEYPPYNWAASVGYTPSY